MIPGNINKQKGEPMQQFKMMYIAAMFFILAITGCKKDDPVSAPSTPSGMPALTNFGGATPTNVLVVVRTSTETTVGGVTLVVDATVGTAVFGAPGQDKGDVKVVANATDYAFSKNNVDSNISYTYSPSVANPTGIGVSTGATSVTFSATGYALSPSAVTVPGQLKLTAPAANASVARSADLALSWTITNPGFRSAVFITDYSGNFKFYENLTGTSFSIPAADMQSLAAGNAIVYAISYNYVLANSNAAVLIGQAVALRTITLQ